MQRKSIFTILGVMLAVVVASLTLVFAVGPMVSADDENSEPKIGLLDKAEYFNITYEDYDDELGYAPVVLSGLSLLGDEYIGRYDYYDGHSRCENFDELCVVVPYGVTEIRGFFDYVYGGYYTLFGAFSYFNMEEKGEYYYNYATGAVTSVILPDTLRVIDCAAFYAAGIESITLPINVTKIGTTYSHGVIDIFSGCVNLREIIVQNPDLLTNENLQPYADIMRYEAPQYTVTFDTVGGNTIDNQKITKNEFVTKPADPTKDGYNFLGWFVGDDEYDFTMPVTGSLTLTAKWEAVASQNNENQNQENLNNETDTVTENNKFNPLMAWVGGGIAVTLSLIAVAGIVVAKKRRK